MPRKITAQKSWKRKAEVDSFGWLLPEGYMWQMEGTYDRPRRIERLNETVSYLMETLAVAGPERLTVDDGRWLGLLRTLVTGRFRARSTNERSSSGVAPVILFSVPRMSAAFSVENPRATAWVR